MNYTVNKDADGQFVAELVDSIGIVQKVLGRRPKYKAAQRLAEQTAGRPLDWTSLGGGSYIGK